MTVDRWVERDLPVLRALVDHFDEHPGEMIEDHEVQRLVDLDVGVEGSLRRLRSGDYVDLLEAESLGAPSTYAVRDVTERALRAVGAWPSAEEATQRFLDALQEAVRDAATPEERTRAQKVLDGFKGMSSTVATGVMSAVIGSSITG